MASGEEEAGAVLVEEAFALQEARDLVPEELFGGGGADVRYGHPLAGAGPAAAGDEGVDVGMEIELVSERLDDGHHAGSEGLFLAGRYGHQLADGLPGRGTERAEELSVMHEVGAKELGDGEDPLGVADVGDDLVPEQGGELGGALGAAGWAEPAPFTREGEQVLGGAIGTADAGEASLEDAGVELSRDHAVQEAAPEARRQKLAIAKLHTNVPSWGPCPPHSTGPCVSKTETKATYAMARTLAQLARLHVGEGQEQEARRAFGLGRTAFTNARVEPPLCRDFPDFGGEGGIYPDNDVCALWRDPASHREPSHPGRDNIEDDAYSALVEMFLTSRVLGDPGTAALAKEVAAHPRLGEIAEFWWMAVAPTANLSLLTLHPEGIDLTPVRRQLFAYADECVKQMRVGYPGVTQDAGSDRWKSGDKDDVDANWRWGSNRMLLDDAIVLAVAAEEKARAGDRKAAAAYAGHAVRVMDCILGTNAMALSMVTGFGENAVERLHDTIVPDAEPGKMALGPNDWTNAGDPDMPAFGSLPGMKLMPVKGRGWAARESAIDGNAPLV